jgi:8-oxo-dGTP pyrophosphatase MutT (NUDIX family)
MTNDQTHRFPVSAKGVVFFGTRVPLLLNERDEWELPGGKVGKLEPVEDCLQRELEEELGIVCTVGKILGCYNYHIADRWPVIVVGYVCYTDDPPDRCRVSHEHKQVRLIDISAMDSFNIPQIYKSWIRLAFGRRDELATSAIRTWTPFSVL